MYDLIQGVQKGELFETAESVRKHTLAEAIKTVLNIDYNGQIRSDLLGGNNSGSQRGQRSGARSTASGESVESREGTADGGRRTDGDSGIEKENIKNPLSEKNKEVTDIHYLDPRTMPDEEKQKRGEMLRDADIIEVQENAITSTKDLSARKAAEKWWDDNISEPLFYNTEAGEVEINKNSIGNSLAHRYSQAKLDAITGLADGFEHAVYLGTLPGTSQDKKMY